MLERVKYRYRIVTAMIAIEVEVTMKPQEFMEQFATDQWLGFRHGTLFVRTSHAMVVELLAEGAG